MARSSLNSLIQISVAIAPAAEDAVSELLTTLFQQPSSIYTHADTGATTATVYIPQKGFSAAAAKRALVKALSELRKNGLDVGPGKIQISKIRRENWAESWKKHFKPIEVGEKLLIKPSWSKRKARKGEAVVILDPGLSFGTGQHATTSFCLEQIVACRKKTNQSLLDIGSGSGILAISAAKLGYAPVQAFDFDPEAVRVSRENCKRNRVDKVVRPAQQDLTKLPKTASRKFDIVCANLIYDLLIAEAEKIVNRVKPDGDLLLAGILKTQFPQVRRAFEKLNLKLVATGLENEWQSGHFRFTAP